MKYVVTGANGLIGKALSLKLAEEGHSVVALFRSTSPSEFQNHPRIEVFKGDVQDKEALVKAFKNADGVFHVAAFAKPWTKDPLLYYKINEHGTRNVCDAALTCGVKRVVYTASAGIHGPQQNGFISEDTWPKEYHTDYERSKNNGRLAALSFLERGLEVNIVSPARVYAPGKVTESNVPARMLSLYLKNKFGFVPTGGYGIGSYVHIDDVIHGHILAMTKANSGEEYLLGGDNLSYLDFFSIIAEKSGRKYPVIRVPYQLSLIIGKTQLFMAETFGIKPAITTPWIRRYLKDWGISSKKMEVLGYKPRTFKEGVMDLLSP